METKPNVRGQLLLHRSGRTIEPLHPAFVERHPTASGWIWFGLIAVLLMVCNVVHAPEALRVTLSLAAVIPSLGATLLVLSQTPRTHLEYEPSILGHFFSRFFALLGALILWIGSVVLGAAVAVQLASDAGTDVDRAWDEAIDIFGGAVPLIVAMLWAVLVFRCVGYIARLRGWSAAPEHHRIPEHFFADLPRTRRILIGLAHPALLLIAGLLSILLVFVAAIDVGPLNGS